MPGPADLMAHIKARNGGDGGGDDNDDKDAAGGEGNNMTRKSTPVGLMAALEGRKAGGGAPKSFQTKTTTVNSNGGRGGEAVNNNNNKATLKIPEGKLYHYEESIESFLFDFSNTTPRLTSDAYGNQNTDIMVPLSPCIYRMTDYTLAKKEPITLKRCVLKLNVLRCLARECQTLNNLLWHRFCPTTKEYQHRKTHTLEEDELGKVRFMELISNCGVFQKVSELILQRAGQVADLVVVDNNNNNNMGAVKTEGDDNNNNNDNKNKNLYRIPQVQVEGLEDFLQAIEDLVPTLKQARDEIEQTQSVNFYPGLGELFCPGSKVLCYPEGMEGSPLGCSCVQSWYSEELNKATNKMKRRFVLVVEFIVSVGDELVFVAATDVYPEFHDPSRSVPLRDLTHRKLDPGNNAEDASMLQRLQQRGEFYASVATNNHYLEYYPHSFFPIIGGGWRSNAVRPLSKGGRVMVDVKRGILEGHLPVRGTSDGMSDTVKEAIKLFEQNKRTGIAVPFRTAILPGFETTHLSKKKRLQLGDIEERGDSDRPSLWQSWPMLTGFSFTARVWGKLLLGMPKDIPSGFKQGHMVKRTSRSKLGVEMGGLGGEGSCGNCGYIMFQEQAFEQLVLADDKKELIRAVARNAGGSAQWDDDDEDGVMDYDDKDEVGLDVVANKGGASIFLLHGPPGCGKTLTAEAIAELLRQPLYIVTAGDLGITAAEVEKTLGAVLELCQTWDALVLIDEADIFLEARNSAEIERNALVCVMLRLLEYYSGCLFLSSNRAAGSIDAAIASRITVMLSYPPLDMDGRAKVWRNLIELVPSQPLNPDTGGISEAISKNPRKASKYRVDFTDSDYKDLASKYQLNGRQIKNSIVLARALAKERGTPLAMPILQRAVTAVAGENATT